MNIGYSYWGFLGDYKLGPDGKELSTPDGNAFYSWCIIKKLQELGHSVYLIMPDRDINGYTLMGRKLFNAWLRDERASAYENTLKCVNIKSLDFIIAEWRFKIEGRNFGPDATQPDYYIQDKMLKEAKKNNIPVIVFDLDYKLAVDDINEYGIQSIIELGDKWQGKLCKRVEIPFDFRHINYFKPSMKTSGTVYVGNRYERDASVDKYLAKLRNCTVYGNWEEAGRNSSSKWPNIKFCDRIPARQMRSAYENKTTTVLLAKDGYYRQGFMTARILEAIFYGVVPLFPEEFGEEIIKKYAGECALELTVSDCLDVLAVTENFTAEQEYKLEVIEYLREHLKFMDVSYFVDTVLSIYSEYVKGQ